MVALMDIRMAAAEGHDLPRPAGLDPQSEPSTDPNAILETRSLLPFGEHKGAAIAFMVEVLGAALAGGTLSVDNKERESFGALNHQRWCDPDCHRSHPVRQRGLQRICRSHLRRDFRQRVRPGSGRRSPCKTGSRRSPWYRREYRGSGLHLAETEITRYRMAGQHLPGLPTTPLNGRRNRPRAGVCHFSIRQLYPTSASARTPAHRCGWQGTGQKLAFCSVMTTVSPYSLFS